MNNNAVDEGGRNSRTRDRERPKRQQSVEVSAVDASQPIRLSDAAWHWIKTGEWVDAVDPHARSTGKPVTRDKDRG